MNKIIVSIVLAIIFVLVVNKVTDVIFYVEKPEKSAYQVASVTSTANTTTSEESSVVSESGDIMALFASTSAADGKKIFKKCLSCHSIAKEGKNKIVLFHPTIPDRAISEVIDTLKSRWIGQGPKVEKLESKFKELKVSLIIHFPSLPPIISPGIVKVSPLI